MDVLSSEGYLKEQERPNREFGVALGAAAMPRLSRGMEVRKRSDSRAEVEMELTQPT